MIEVKFDPTLIMPTIEVPMARESTENDPEGGAYQLQQQTLFDGIVAPLVKLNNLTIDPSQIIHMELTLGNVPGIYIEISDSANYFSILSGPDQDCFLQLQILPPSDNTYKKINLLFQCGMIKYSRSVIRIRGSYYVSSFKDCVMKPYGKMSTYELFEQIAHEYGLGFASNICSTEDVRWIYNPNMTTLDFLNREIVYSDTVKSNQNSQGKHLLQWWIDFRNYLNLVDIYAEYEEVVSESNDYMQIWIESVFHDIESGSSKIDPVQAMALFTNFPGMMTSETYMRDGYSNEAGAVITTDLNYEVFNMESLEKTSTIIMDGDIQKNTSIGYNYGGEVFGDYDYLTRRACRDIFMNKINSRNIVVPMRSSLLSLDKGYKVNVYWYDINSQLTTDIQDEQNQNLSSNIDLPESVRMQDANYIINKTISGQYTILGEKIVFDAGGSWLHTYTLGRPAGDINKIDSNTSE